MRIELFIWGLLNALFFILEVIGKKIFLHRTIQDLNYTIKHLICVFSGAIYIIVLVCVNLVGYTIGIIAVNNNIKTFLLSKIYKWDFLYVLFVTFYFLCIGVSFMIFLENNYYVNRNKNKSTNMHINKSENINMNENNNANKNMNNHVNININENNVINSNKNNDINIKTKINSNDNNSNHRYHNNSTSNRSINSSINNNSRSINKTSNSNNDINNENNNNDCSSSSKKEN